MRIWYSYVAIFSITYIYMYVYIYISLIFDSNITNIVQFVKNLNISVTFIYICDNLKVAKLEDP